MFSGNKIYCWTVVVVYVNIAVISVFGLGTVDVGGGYVFQERRLESTKVHQALSFTYRFERCSQNSFSSKSMYMEFKWNENSNKAATFCANACKTINGCRYFMIKIDGYSYVDGVDKMRNCYFYSACTIGDRMSSQDFWLWELKTFNFIKIHDGVKGQKRCNPNSFRSKSYNLQDCKNYCSQFPGCKFFMTPYPAENKCWLYEECDPLRSAAVKYNIYEKLYSNDVEFIKGNGANYRGYQSSTGTGKQCQKWTLQSPHKHSRTPANYRDRGLGNHNYCRNPDGSKTIWCYTTNPAKRWEFCAPMSSSFISIYEMIEIDVFTSVTITIIIILCFICMVRHYYSKKEYKMVKVEYEEDDVEQNKSQL